MKKLYVGNLSYSMTDSQLSDLFSPFGTVVSARIIVDRNTNRSKGFGFVEMEEGADEAITSLNETEVDGRKIVVNEARPEKPRQNTNRY